VKKEKIIAELEKRRKPTHKRHKSYYLELAELQERKKNKLNSDLPNYELNETKKKIIELENKIVNYKPKTNLMIAEYKKTIDEN
jgi:inner membrane protein